MRIQKFKIFAKEAQLLWRWGADPEAGEDGREGVGFCARHFRAGDARRPYHHADAEHVPTGVTAAALPPPRPHPPWTPTPVLSLCLSAFRRGGGGGAAGGGGCLANPRSFWATPTFPCLLRPSSLCPPYPAQGHERRLGGCINSTSISSIESRMEQGNVVAVVVIIITIVTIIIGIGIQRHSSAAEAEGREEAHTKATQPDSEEQAHDPKCPLYEGVEEDEGGVVSPPCHSSLPLRMSRFVSRACAQQIQCFCSHVWNGQGGLVTSSSLFRSAVLSQLLRRARGRLREGSSGMYVHVMFQCHRGRRGRRRRMRRRGKQAWWTRRG